VSTVGCAGLYFQASNPDTNVAISQPQKSAGILNGIWPKLLPLTNAHFADRHVQEIGFIRMVAKGWIGVQIKSVQYKTKN